MPPRDPDQGTPISDLQTPALLLHRDRLEENLEAMRTRARELDVELRPHIKTAKTLPVAQQALGDVGTGLTVSTLREAEALQEGGFEDLVYAVAIAPDKLDRAADLREQGADLKLLVDTPGAARAIVEAGQQLEDEIPVLLEIDCDGTRGGIAPDEPILGYVAELLAEGEGAHLAGVLTHAGSAYEARGEEELQQAAIQEKDAVVTAANRLREAGHEVPIVSVGSTPTAMVAEELTGVTEMRPGNYVFFDLYQAGLGVCDVSDVAVSVLATVIGHRDSDHVPIVDAGSLALSEDRSTGAFDDERDVGYGLVADIEGDLLAEGRVIVTETSQEHGILSHREADRIDLRLGERVRILPNHSCITAACHPRYAVEDEGIVVDTWDRVNHW